MLKSAFAPNGLPIIGTFEELEAVARAQVFWDEQAQEATVAYTGTTEPYWDSQLTVMDETGENRVFVDSEHNTWLENQLVFKEP